MFEVHYMIKITWLKQQNSTTASKIFKQQIDKYVLFKKKLQENRIEKYHTGYLKVQAKQM